MSTSFLSRTLNRAFFYGISGVLGNIIGFIMLAIYTHNLTPTDYGVASFLIMYCSLIQTLFGGQFQAAINKFHFDTELNYSLNSLITTASITTLLFCLLPMYATFNFSESISILMFQDVQYATCVQIITAYILFFTVQEYSMGYIRIKDKPKVFFFISLIGLLTQLVLNIIFIVIMKLGVIGMLFGTIAGPMVRWALSFSYFLFKEKKPTFEKASIKPLIKYCYPLWITGLITLYTGSSYQVALNYFGSLADLGLYSLANSFAALLGTLLLNPFWTFWQVERFRIYNEANAQKKFQQIYGVLMPISFLACVGLSAFCFPLIELLTEESFHPAASAVLPIALFTVVYYLGWFFDFSFHVTANTQVLAKNAIVLACILTLVLPLLTIKFGFTGAAYAVFLGHLLYLSYVKFRSAKFYNMGISLKLTYLSIFICVILGTGFEQLYTFIASPIEYTLLITAFFAISFLVGFYILYRYHPENYNLLRNTVIGVSPKLATFIPSTTVK